MNRKLRFHELNPAGSLQIVLVSVKGGQYSMYNAISAKDNVGLDPALSQISCVTLGKFLNLFADVLFALQSVNKMVRLT